MQLEPANDWCARNWPVCMRTQRRYELNPDDPFPVRRVGRRRYVKTDEANAWLARQAGVTPDEQAETEQMVDRAARTGESLGDLAAQRRGERA